MMPAKNPEFDLATGGRSSVQPGTANASLVRVSVDIQSRTSVELQRRKSSTPNPQLPSVVVGASTASDSTAASAAAVAEQKKREAALKAADVVVHKYSAAELTTFLRTDLNRGISAHESKTKLQQDGLNLLTPPKETPWYIKLLMQMVGGFQLMMLGGSILCFIVGPISDPIDYQTIYLGVVLIFVVITTGLFVFYQESKSDSVMAGFKALTPSICNVLRDGQVIQIDAKELVVGDICMVNGGEKVRSHAHELCISAKILNPAQVPADCRVLESVNLKVFGQLVSLTSFK
jgi:magnesium-transporting ATPase (P-type)